MHLEDGVAVWSLVTPGGITGGPSPRFGAFSGMDEQSGRLVLFSGQTSFGQSFGQDTWVLDVRAAAGPTWSEVTPPGSPAGRRNGTSVWDPTGPRLFVFGGTSDGATSQPGLFAFDARAGHESWAEIDRADPRTPPTATSRGSGTDPERRPLPAHDVESHPAGSRGPRDGAQRVGSIQPVDHQVGA